MTEYERVVMSVLWENEIPMTRREIAECIPSHAPNSTRRVIADLIEKGMVESVEPMKERGNRLVAAISKEEYLEDVINDCKPDINALIELLRRTK